MNHKKQKHIKTTLITAEQYLWDQLNKNIGTDSLEDVLKQFEKQTEHNIMHIHNEQTNKVPTDNDNSEVEE